MNSSLSAFTIFLKGSTLPVKIWPDMLSRSCCLILRYLSAMGKRCTKLSTSFISTSSLPARSTARASLFSSTSTSAISERISSNSLSTGASNPFTTGCILLRRSSVSITQSRSDKILSSCSSRDLPACQRRVNDMSFGAATRVFAVASALIYRVCLMIILAPSRVTFTLGLRESLLVRSSSLASVILFITPTREALAAGSLFFSRRFLAFSKPSFAA